MEAWGVLTFRMLQDVNRGSRANGKGDKPGGPIGSLAIDPDSVILPTCPCNKENEVLPILQHRRLKLFNVSQIFKHVFKNENRLRPAEILSLLVTCDAGTQARLS